MRPQTFLILASIVTAAFITAAGMMHLQLRELERRQAQFVAYTYIHQHNVQKLDRFDDVIEQCWTWLREGDG